MFRKSIKLIIPVLLILSSCTTSEKSVVQGSARDVPFERIFDKNAYRFDKSFESDLKLSVSMAGRKNSARGRVYYSAAESRWRLIIKDPFFGMILFHILIENNEIKIYSVRERIVQSTPAGMPDGFFSGDYTPPVIFFVASGRIPLFAPPAQYDFNGTRAEYSGDQFFHSLTVSPEGIITAMLIRNNEKSREYSIEYDNFSDSGSMKYFSKIRAREKISGDSFEVEFSSLREGEPDPNVFRLNIPPGVTEVKY